MEARAVNEASRVNPFPADVMNIAVKTARLSPEDRLLIDAVVDVLLRHHPPVEMTK